MAPSRAADRHDSQIANRFAGFGSTIFSEISQLAAEHDAINLGQGFPNFDGPDFVKEAAMAAMKQGQNQYARSSGVPALNHALAERYEAETGLAVDADREITVTTGCTEALAASFLGLINPGDEVIIFEPYYDSYRACAAIAGATVRYVTLHTPDFAIEWDELSRAFSEKTRAILINTPHNPTGRVFNREELELIASLCREHDVIAITDEVYERLIFEGAHICLATLDGMYERTVTLSSLGKTFSLTGWKVGWAVAPPKMTRAIRTAHQFLTFCSATPLQHGAVAAASAADDYYDRYIAAYRRRREVLVEGLRDVGFEVFPPQGTYFVLADHTRFGFPDDVAFCQHLVHEVGVAAIPPSAFYHESTDGRNLVRFAFCKDVDTLQTAVERMRSSEMVG